MGETLANAAFNTLIGMGTVFIVLILISFIIYLFKFIGRAEEKIRNKGKKNENPAKTPEAPAPVPAETPPETDETELVAVIAAAIAAYEGTSADGITVRSIRRIGETKRRRVYS